jgi:hypothetical protein
LQTRPFACYGVLKRMFSGGLQYRNCVLLVRVRRQLSNFALSGHTAVAYSICHEIDNMALGTFCARSSVKPFA